MRKCRDFDTATLWKRKRTTTRNSMTTHILKRPGLLNLKTVTRYLGIDRRHADRLIKQDDLPIVSVPTAKGIKQKVSIAALHRWMSARCDNAAPTLEELHAEIKLIQP